MPIAKNPDVRSAKPLVARFWDEDGNRCQIPCRNEFEAEMTMLERAGPKSRKDMSALHIEPVVEVYLRLQEQRGVVAISLRNERSILDRLVRTPLQGKVMSDLVFQDFVDIRKAIVAAYSPKTAETYLGFATRFFNFAYFKGCLTSNPMRVAKQAHKVDLNKLTKQPVIPLPEDVDLLRKAAGACDTAVLDLMVECGASVSDLQKLRWEDLNFETRKVFFRALVLKGDDSSKPAGRTVPMGDLTASSLQVWRRMQSMRQNQPLVFHTERGATALSSQCMTTALNRLQSSVGLVRKGPRGKLVLPKYTAKCFRHIAAVRWAGSGASMKVIAARLGYSSSQTVWAKYRKYFVQSVTAGHLAAISNFLRGGKE